MWEWSLGTYRTAHITSSHMYLMTKLICLASCRIFGGSSKLAVDHHWVLSLHVSHKRCGGHSAMNCGSTVWFLHREACVATERGIMFILDRLSLARYLQLSTFMYGRAILHEVNNRFLKYSLLNRHLSRQTKYLPTNGFRYGHQLFSIFRKKLRV